MHQSLLYNIKPTKQFELQLSPKSSWPSIPEISHKENEVCLALGRRVKNNNFKGNLFGVTMYLFLLEEDNKFISTD